MSIIVDIVKSTYGGYGLAFHEKKAIFVPFTIPGEKVEIEQTLIKKDFSFAKVINIISPSKDRIVAECPNFSICGGCSYLHMTFEREIQEKQSILIDCLTRIAKIPEEKVPIINIINDNRFHYRSHATIKCDNLNIGFYKKDSNTIVNFPKNGCLLLNEKIISEIRDIKNTNQKEIKLAIDHNNKCYTSNSKKNIVLNEKENNIIYKRNIYSFFQSNLFIRSKMLDTVKEYTNAKSKDSIIDIGCGVGFFTLYLAKYCKEITGFDISKESINFAKKNAKLNKINNVKFYAIKDSSINPFKCNANIILADPPRAGLSKKARYTINKIDAEKIVYVSCNPTTWARDIKDFLKNNYKIVKLTFINMFPATDHIEIISLLKKH